MDAKKTGFLNTISPDRSWRMAFQEVQNSVSRKKSFQPQPRACIVIEPDPRDEESIRFSFYTCEVDLEGHPVSTPKQMVLPSGGIIQFGDAAFRESYKTLYAILLSDTDPQRYRYGGYYGFNQELFFLTIKASSLGSVLPGLLERAPVFASSEEFLKFLQGSSDLSLKYAPFGPMKLEVLEQDSNFLLDAKIPVQGPSVSVSELRLFSRSHLYRHGNFLGFMELSKEETVWMEILQKGALRILAEDVEAFLEAILNQPLHFNLPLKLDWPKRTEKPQVKVQLVAEKRPDADVGRYLFDLRFQYGPRSVSYKSSLMQLPSEEEQKVYLRDEEEEMKVWNLLPVDMLLTRTIDGSKELVLSMKNLLDFVRKVFEAGLPIEIENKKVQTTSDFQISVTSGVDWFDVSGQAEFSGLWVKFPTLLEAVVKGESFVPLPDGSLGLMNETLKKRLEKLADFAESSKKGLRFSQAQGLLLNSLLELESEQNLNLDAKFEQLRQKIKNFSGLSIGEAVPSFKGKLRKYQKEGLGWLNFLDSFGLGGILADDMGLGKTIQCLAFLEGRRTRSKRKIPPSLLLAPKSLLSNWQSEGQKFTPDMKILVLAGTERESRSEIFRQYDLVITTYQTMLRDLETIQKMPWDCVILDEAQAIKNPEALISKASKLLPSKFRLAMTGTPIENSIQDLFSISDFVNPGFLHGKRRSAHLKLSEESKQILSKAFKPVILRRKKEQVLKDLPEKTEQLIMVDLEAKQLKAYNELKRFYQSQLLRDVNEKGVKKSQIQILAALTRLRQAALHAALIDPSQIRTKSAKFEIVLEMLEEGISEGHRVLIFSQFTSLLELFKSELNKRKIRFCYLDGNTANRKQVVNDFKMESYPVFLMSLKAGGVGLNLVEADYVFLMDPWWNPAAEAQAIDRVHRIGQKKAVNAYRFIAKNTVEEKILELQKTKQGISEEILDGQSGLMRNLTAQDLENLLS